MKIYLLGILILLFSVAQADNPFTVQSAPQQSYLFSDNQIFRSVRWDVTQFIFLNDENKISINLFLPDNRSVYYLALNHTYYFDSEIVDIVLDFTRSSLLILFTQKVCQYAINYEEIREIQCGNFSTYPKLKYLQTFDNQTLMLGADNLILFLNSTYPSNFSIISVFNTSITGIGLRVTVSADKSMIYYPTESLGTDFLILNSTNISDVSILYSGKHSAYGINRIIEHPNYPDIIYIMEIWEKLKVFNSSNLKTSKQIQMLDAFQIPGGGYASSIKIVPQNNMIMMNVVGQGLLLFDISNPAKLLLYQILEIKYIVNFYVQLEEDVNYLILIKDYGIQLFRENIVNLNQDYPNLLNLQQQGIWLNNENPQAYPWGLEFNADETILYVCFTQLGLYLFNITEKLTPTKITSYMGIYEGTMSVLAINRTRGLYVFAINLRGVQISDFSDIYNPINISLVPIMSVNQHLSFAFTNNQVYVSSGHSGFSVVDITDIQAPFLVYTSQTGFVFSVNINKDKTVTAAALSDYGFGLYSTDLATTYALVYTGGSNYVLFSQTVNHILFIADSINGVKVYNVMNPKNPVLVDKVTNLGNVWFLYFFGTEYLLVGSQDGYELACLKIENQSKGQIKLFQVYIKNEFNSHKMITTANQEYLYLMNVQGMRAVRIKYSEMLNSEVYVYNATYRRYQITMQNDKIYRGKFVQIKLDTIYNTIFKQLQSVFMYDPNLGLVRLPSWIYTVKNDPSLLQIGFSQSIPDILLLVSKVVRPLSQKDFAQIGVDFYEIIKELRDLSLVNRDLFITELFSEKTIINFNNPLIQEYGFQIKKILIESITYLPSQILFQDSLVFDPSDSKGQYIQTLSQYLTVSFEIDSSQMAYFEPKTNKKQVQFSGWIEKINDYLHNMHIYTYLESSEVLIEVKIIDKLNSEILKVYTLDSLKFIEIVGNFTVLHSLQQQFGEQFRNGIHYREKRFVFLINSITFQQINGVISQRSYFLQLDSKGKSRNLSSSDGEGGLVFNAETLVVQGSTKYLSSQFNLTLIVTDGFFSLSEVVTVKMRDFTPEFIANTIMIMSLAIFVVLVIVKLRTKFKDLLIGYGLQVQDLNIMQNRKKVVRICCYTSSLARLDKIISHFRSDPATIEEFLMEGSLFDRRGYLKYCQKLDQEVYLSEPWDDKANLDNQITLALGYRLALEHSSSVNREIYRRLRDFAMQNGMTTQNWFEFYLVNINTLKDEFLTPQYELDVRVIEDIICFVIWPQIKMTFNLKQDDYNLLNSQFVDNSFSVKSQAKTAPKISKENISREKDNSFHQSNINMDLIFQNLVYEGQGLNILQEENLYSINEDYPDQLTYKLYCKIPYKNRFMRRFGFYELIPINEDRRFNRSKQDFLEVKITENLSIDIRIAPKMADLGSYVFQIKNRYGDIKKQFNIYVRARE